MKAVCVWPAPGGAAGAGVLVLSRGFPVTGGSAVMATMEGGPPHGGRATMEGGPPHGWLVETEGRKELWMAFVEDPENFPDVAKVGRWDGWV